MNTTNIIVALGSLEPAELLLVRAACNQLLGEKNAPVTTASPLYDALLHVTGQKMPFKRFLATETAKRWADNERIVMDFVASNWPQVTDQVPRLALLCYLVKLLAEDLRRCDLPSKLGTLARNLHTIPDVYEYAFPGYRAAGLNHVVLAQVLK